MKRENLAVFTLGDWAEAIVYRTGSQYFLRRNIRITGQKNAEIRCSKEDARSIETAEDFDDTWNMLVTTGHKIHTTITR
jgi:hypothetical protein